MKLGKFPEFLISSFQMSLPIKRFTIQEVSSVINNEVQPTKVPGYDVITGQVLQALRRQAICLVTVIFNAVI